MARLVPEEENVTESRDCNGFSISTTLFCFFSFTFTQTLVCFVITCYSSLSPARLMFFISINITHRISLRLYILQTSQMSLCQVWVKSYKRYKWDDISIQCREVWGGDVVSEHVCGVAFSSICWFDSRLHIMTQQWHLSHGSTWWRSKRLLVLDHGC